MDWQNSAGSPVHCLIHRDGIQWVHFLDLFEVQVQSPTKSHDVQDHPPLFAAHNLWTLVNHLTRPHHK